MKGTSLAVPIVRIAECCIKGYTDMNTQFQKRPKDCAVKPYTLNPKSGDLDTSTLNP